MQYCITFFPYLFSWFSKLSFINKILGQFTFNYLFLTLPFTTVLSIQKVYEVTPSNTSEPLFISTWISDPFCIHVFHILFLFIYFSWWAHLMRLLYLQTFKRITALPGKGEAVKTS